MNEEQQRIKIAEACGWKRCKSPLQSQSDERMLYWQNPKNRKVFKTQPDYLNDLNAMHSAIESLSYENQIEWVYALGEVLGFENRNEWLEIYMIQATAKQRAEAFLRTLSLWEESE